LKHFAGVTRCSGHFQTSSGHTIPHHPVFLSGLSLDISVPGVFGLTAEVIVINPGFEMKVLRLYKKPFIHIVSFNNSQYPQAPASVISGIQNNIS
jgi:hypothetical protein